MPATVDTTSQYQGITVISSERCAVIFSIPIALILCSFAGMPPVGSRLVPKLLSEVGGQTILQIGIGHRLWRIAIKQNYSINCQAKARIVLLLGNATGQIDNTHHAGSYVFSKMSGLQG